MSLLHNKRQRDKAMSCSSANDNRSVMSSSHLTSVSRIELADRLSSLIEKDFDLGMITAKKLKCGFCEKDITSDVKVICIQCDNIPVYCLNCLIKRVSKDGTLHPHDYHVIDKIEFPMFTLKWSIREEMKLLAGIERHGLDNWEDISDFLKTKTKEECEAHYYCFYYQNERIKTPLMKDIILKKTMPSLGDYPKVVIEDNIRKENEAKDGALLQLIYANKGTIPQETLNKQNQLKGKKPSDSSKPKASSSKAPTVPKPGPIDENKLIGFYPKRLEFDVEYLNDAELDIAELEFYDEDTEEDKTLKVRMIQLYNKELDEREKRKRFVIERKLYDVKNQMKIESKMPKEEREIYNCLKPFARFLSPSQFNELFEGIVLEKNLRRRIAQLQRFKAKGCATYEEIVEAENEENKGKRGSARDNVNAMLAETCGIGNKLKTYLINSSNELDDNSTEREKEFINRIGISKGNYKELKETITRKIMTKERDSAREKEKEKRANNLEKIVDFAFEYSSSGVIKERQ